MRRVLGLKYYTKKTLFIWSRRECSFTRFKEKTVIKTLPICYTPSSTFARNWFEGVVAEIDERFVYEYRLEFIRKSYVVLTSKEEGSA